MNSDLWLLVMTAAGVGVFHTLLGPDHYLPFVMMQRAQKWSLARTAAITGICGVGHLVGSIVLGSIGIAFGLGISRIETVESTRGDLAAWGLIAFGLMYLIWGVRQAYRNRPHVHVHVHEDGVVHKHEHNHHGAHAHAHTENATNPITPWVLFTVFVFGPCEALVPMLMYPAANASLVGVAAVTVVFSVATVATMLTAVLLLSIGFERFSFGRFERYTHALAGAAILTCGLAIQFLAI